MKFLIPIFLIIISGLVFFVFADPIYKETTGLKKEAALFEQALDNSKELMATRDKLLTQRNSFSQNDIDNLEKLLPNNIDNVRLVRDIDGIARNYEMSPRGVSVEVASDSTNLSPTAKPFGSIVVSFSVTGPYDVFLDFLADLEKSLRIVDVVSVAFTASEEDSYEYKISLRTYWLR